MDILNKDMNFEMLHDIKTSGMIVIVNGYYYLYSNDELFRHYGNKLPNKRYKYAYLLDNVSPEHTLEWFIDYWRIRNIKFSRKMNHEV
jgi:hypothetical protein